MKIIILLGLVALVMTSAPIPSHPDGFQWNNPTNKKVRLDVWEDLLCIDCKEAVPAFKDFMNSKSANGEAISDLVEVHVHYLPLPLHHHAFIVHQASYLTYDVTGSVDLVEAFGDWVFDHQSEFQSTSSKSLTELDVISKLCEEAGANSQFGWSESECLTSYSKRSTDMAVRSSFKFAAYNSVTGTPSVHVNGVEAPSFPESVSEWNSLLSASLKSNTAMEESM